MKKKRSKRSRLRGRRTCGYGARKKHKGKGSKGGKGMAGTGKRADQKKTLITKLYGNKYFGKQGITSKRTERDKRKRISLGTIELNLEKYGEKTENGFKIDLSDYKILGKRKLKNRLFIKAKEASESAIKRVKEKGGEIELSQKKH